MYRNGTSSLDDLLMVGPDKPVGYKRLEDLALLCHVEPADLQAQLESRGLRTLILTGADCAMKTGALYAWDENALNAHLARHAGTLASCGWPATAEEFVRRLAIDWVQEKTQLFDIIADAFGDHDNPRRTDCAGPWNPRPNHCPAGP